MTAISRTFWMRIFCIILVFMLVLNAVETRPLKKTKRNSQPKHCGTKGHLCQHGSRKLCCASGYTCRLEKVAINVTRPETKKKRKIGTCQPVKQGEIEIDELNPTQTTEATNSTTVPPTPKPSSIPSVYALKEGRTTRHWPCPCRSGQTYYLPKKLIVDVIYILEVYL